MVMVPGFDEGRPETFRLVQQLQARMAGKLTEEIKPGKRHAALIERLGGPTFDEIKLLCRPYAPDCGLYFLFKDGALQYVGQSQNVPVRLFQHHWAGKLFDSVAFVPWPRETLLEAERAYINMLKPPLNGSPGIHTGDQPANEDDPLCVDTEQVCG